MIVRFQKIDTAAGMVKRSSEYSTPLITPATEKKSTLGSRMRRSRAASTAPSGVAVNSGKSALATGPAAMKRTVTTPPTTTPMKPSSSPPSSKARSRRPATRRAVKTGTKAALKAASAKSCCTRFGTTLTEISVLYAGSTP